MLTCFCPPQMKAKINYSPLLKSSASYLLTLLQPMMRANLREQCWWFRHLKFLQAKAKYFPSYCLLYLE